MELLNQFLFGDPNVQKALAPLAIAAIASAVPGVVKAVGSLFGGGKRRREERAAQKAMDMRRKEYESFQFQNPAANMTNPFEDLRTNTQAADFVAQQQQQALAGTLAGLKGTAGSSGIAALAQSLASQQSRNLQAASASIAQQEQANQMARAKGQMALERAQAAGQQYVEGQQLRRTQTLLGMEQQRLGMAKRARAQAKSDLIGGIAEAAGAAAQTYAGNLGGGNKGIAAPQKIGAQKFEIPEITTSGPSLSEQNQILRSRLGG